MEKILAALTLIKFPKNRTRNNVAMVSTSFVLGEVNYRGQACLNYKTRGPSSYNKKFPQLYNILLEFMKTNYPDFKFTTIQVNKNVLSQPHIDKNNIGPSLIFALGDYSGGSLVIEGKPYNIKNTILYFDGKKGHWVEPFVGDRYSIVFFTHTFKPPNPSERKIKVQKDGLYKNGQLIKKYPVE